MLSYVILIISYTSSTLLTKCLRLIFSPTITIFSGRWARKNFLRRRKLQTHSSRKGHVRAVYHAAYGRKAQSKIDSEIFAARVQPRIGNGAYSRRPWKCLWGSVKFQLQYSNSVKKVIQNWNQTPCEIHFLERKDKWLLFSNPQVPFLLLNRRLYLYWRWYSKENKLKVSQAERKGTESCKSGFPIEAALTIPVSMARALCEIPFSIKMTPRTNGSRSTLS